MDTTRRRSRHNSFTIFRSQSENVFLRLAKSDLRHERRSQFFSFYIIPKGRWGRNDPTTVDIFYGRRSLGRFRNYGKSTSIFDVQEETLAESGTTLRYQQIPNGLVLCILIPSRTQTLSPSFDFVILANGIEPYTLTGDNTLRKHWKIFSSFAESYSMDGEPDIWDKLRVWWVLFSKPICVDNHIKERKITSACSKLLFFVLTVGLSGFLLRLIQFLFD
ncbi:hypothetical protein [Oceanidesulfovibrio marinus]|uniref:Uncharacterized protein n=1 Tax=Oceanidesulfovibrio marinus TaxID=370038 RepID=A0ABX6NHU8_9BACT|nr:hypothetical protein [Oceanidesulfovibrio marinus]QJT10132.1 hypothetical protein E8L03_14860 [Oceanidesulfovibrio marinus]